MNYWLMKSEPDAFGIDDLKQRPAQTEPWDGVRNYQARNMMRDDMQVGDQAFFYHSNCAVPGIAGMMKIVRAGYPDASAFDPRGKHHDPKSTPDNPRWFRVDVRYVRKFKRLISLAELKAHPELRGLALLQRGNRLSIMPLTTAQ
ncbi:MAG: EVE domain-containing protein [Proteobacteria bacterium]|nr:EVE domain-containing protein [Pseudomonadota bacterium]